MLENFATDSKNNTGSYFIDDFGNCENPANIGTVRQLSL